MTIDKAYDALKKGQVQQIHKIAVRAAEFDDKLDLMTVEMDLTATNLHCPMDFYRLAACEDNFNFFHDIYGINTHLNRNTFELENFFQPRFAFQ